MAQVYRIASWESVPALGHVQAQRIGSFRTPCAWMEDPHSVLKSSCFYRRHQRTSGGEVCERGGPSEGRLKPFVSVRSQGSERDGWPRGQCVTLSTCQRVNVLDGKLSRKLAAGCCGCHFGRSASPGRVVEEGNLGQCSVPVRSAVAISNLRSPLSCQSPSGFPSHFHRRLSSSSSIAPFSSARALPTHAPSSPGEGDRNRTANTAEEASHTRASMHPITPPDPRSPSQLPGGREDATTATPSMALLRPPAIGACPPQRIRHARQTQTHRRIAGAQRSKKQPDCRWPHSRSLISLAPRFNPSGVRHALHLLPHPHRFLNPHTRSSVLLSPVRSPTLPPPIHSPPSPRRPSSIILPVSPVAMTMAFRASWSMAIRALHPFQSSYSMCSIHIRGLTHRFRSSLIFRT